jgi:hypothetical protein
MAPSSTIDWLFLATCITAFLGGIAYFVWNRATPEALPNPLREELGTEIVWERKGIQGALLIPGRIVPSSLVVLRFRLQNCFNHGRRIGIQLRLSPEKDIRFPDFQWLEIGPLEVGEVLVPLQLSPSTVSRYLLRFELDVAGLGGKRIRRWRAKPLMRPEMQGRYAVTHYGASGTFELVVERDLQEGVSMAAGCESSLVPSWRPDEVATALVRGGARER